MKGFKKFLLISISIILILSLLLGCSARKSSNVESSSDRGVASPAAPAPAPDLAGAPQEDAREDEYSGIGGESDVASPLEPKKVITTINLSFETTEFEKSNEDLNKLIEKYNAYVENSNISYNHYYNQQMYRHGQFTIRVPKESMVSFKTELNLIGHMVSENTNKQDVTKQYQDTESRLNVITIKEERILALLERAEKIEDIIALEDQLSQIIYEKENLKSSLLTLDDKIDFSTVHIQLQEVRKITDTETIETTFGTRIMNAFKNSFFAFKRNMENLIILIIYNIPLLIIFGVILYVVYRYLKKRNKNSIE